MLNNKHVSLISYLQSKKGLSVILSTCTLDKYEILYLAYGHEGQGNSWTKTNVYMKPQAQVIFTGEKKKID